MWAHKLQRRPQERSGVEGFQTTWTSDYGGKRAVRQTYTAAIMQVLMMPERSGFWRR